MTQKYNLTGMTCGGCEANVKLALAAVKYVTAVEVLKDENSATITMDKQMALTDFQNVLAPKYQISVANNGLDNLVGKTCCCSNQPKTIL